MSFETYFFLAILFSISLYIGFLWITRKIQFPFPEGEDSLSMVRIAGQSTSLRWPSTLLEPNALGSYLKIMNVFLLILFQKIFRDRKSMYPLVALWGLASAISTIFIFLIAVDYFTPLIGFIISLLFITSFWPWQTSLNMGHINVATLFFVAGVWTSTHILTPTGDLSPVWLMVTGAFFSCLFFSSSSSIRYFLFASAALIFAKYRLILEQGGLPEAINTIARSHNEAWLVYLVVPIILVFAVLIAVFFQKWVVRGIYTGSAPRWLIHLFSRFRLDMAGKSQFTPEHYLAYAQRKIRRAGLWVFRIYLVWALILYPLGLDFILLFLLGFLPIVVLFTLPNIKRGLSFYWHYLHETQIRQKTAFRGWDEHFMAKGVRVDRYFTAGLAWTPRFFLKFIPGPILIFYGSVIFVVISKIVNSDTPGLINASLILFAALLPWLWGDVTNCPKLARVTFPAYPGILLFIGYALQQIGPATLSRFSPLLFLIIAGLFAWNLWKFLTDIFPSRMTVANLLEALDTRGIKEFYTYSTDYNLQLIETIRPEFRQKYTIHHINNLSEIKNGWIVVPSTSFKTAFWITDNMKSGVDFIKDPVYKRLVEAKDMETVAAVKFKTFGSSPLWIMDSEITSFRDLILHEISAADFYRGYAWLLHSRNLAKI